MHTLSIISQRAAVFLEPAVDEESHVITNILCTSFVKIYENEEVNRADKSPSHC